MADNFDLKKFLKESKALENLNPLLRKENLNEGDIRSKIREYIIAELGNNPSDYDYEEEDVYGDYEDDEMGYFPTMRGLEDEPVDYDESELEEAMVSPDNRVDYLENALKSVWNRGRGNNNIDLKSMAQSLINDMFDDNLNEIDPGEEEADMMDAYADGGFLDEAKKDKKEEEVADVEVTDTETEDIPAEEVPAEEAPAAGGGLEDIAANMKGTENDLMKNLMDALSIAKGMGNEKLETQIGNTLKFFVSEYIGGSEQ